MERAGLCRRWLLASTVPARSIPGTIVAGLLLGLTESMGAALVNPTYQNAYGFLLVVLILVLRPRSGLFGERARIV